MGVVSLHSLYRLDFFLTMAWVLELRLAHFQDLLRFRYVFSLVLVPAGLLVDCGWDGLEPRMGHFQDLWRCRHECVPLGCQNFRTASDYGCVEVGACIRPFQNLGLQMVVSSAWSLCQSSCWWTVTVGGWCQYRTFWESLGAHMAVYPAGYLFQKHYSLTTGGTGRFSYRPFLESVVWLNLAGLPPGAPRLTLEWG